LTVTAEIVIIFIDIRQKRRAYLCQQVEVTKRP